MAVMVFEQPAAAFLTRDGCPTRKFMPPLEDNKRDARIGVPGVVAGDVCPLNEEREP
jgi:hypothetical protein